MNAAFPAIEDLTRRILAIEAARAKSADTHVDEAVQVCKKLQLPLSKFTGPAGFSSLLSRALVLAKAEAPCLRLVKVQPDGSLAGFDEIQHAPDADALAMGRVVLVGQFLGLLATLIGESLTWRLARDTWPDASIYNTDSRREEKP
jgi:hypothetical protein